MTPWPWATAKSAEAMDRIWAREGILEIDKKVHSTNDGKKNKFNVKKESGRLRIEGKNEEQVRVAALPSRTAVDIDLYFTHHPISDILKQTVYPQ